MTDPSVQLHGEVLFIFIVYIMAILVTGGVGYTGAHVCIELMNQGYEVVIVDNFLTSNAETLHNIKNETGKAVKLYAMDLGQKELVERIFKENEIEGVIHFAGIKCTGEYKKKSYSVLLYKFSKYTHVM